MDTLTKAPTLRDRANTTIEQLKSEFVQDSFVFDTKVSQLLIGDYNKALRQEILTIVTGNTPAKCYCTIAAVSNALKSKFLQTELF
jgi:hypothetical protein